MERRGERRDGTGREEGQLSSSSSSSSSSFSSTSSIVSTNPRASTPTFTFFFSNFSLFVYGSFDSRIHSSSFVRNYYSFRGLTRKRRISKKCVYSPDVPPGFLPTSIVVVGFSKGIFRRSAGQAGGWL